MFLNVEILFLYLLFFSRELRTPISNPQTFMTVSLVDMTLWCRETFQLVHLLPPHSSFRGFYFPFASIQPIPVLISVFPRLCSISPPETTFAVPPPRCFDFHLEASSMLFNTKEIGERNRWTTRSVWCYSFANHVTICHVPAPMSWQKLKILSQQEHVFQKVRPLGSKVPVKA